MYHEMSPETGEFIDFMIEHELMDLKNKPKKASTGYMTELQRYLAPFVFSCFNQTIFDMQVLTHELGHAFAGYMAMRNQPISDFYSESTDIAEIHSMSMEQFAYPYAERFFGEQADKFRFAHLQEAVTFVPFGVAVDAFQHICYANPLYTALLKRISKIRITQCFQITHTTATLTEIEIIFPCLRMIFFLLFLKFHCPHRCKCIIDIIHWI